MIDTAAYRNSIANMDLQILKLEYLIRQFPATETAEALATDRYKLSQIRHDMYCAMMLEESVPGKKDLFYPKKRKKQKRITCPCCNGSGMRIDKRTEKRRICLGCQGTGKIKNDL